MVQILPEAPSFGTELARGLGAGFSSGISKSSDLASELMKENYKQKMAQNLYSSIRRNKGSNMAKDLSGQSDLDDSSFTNDELLQMKMSGNKQLSDAADFILKAQEQEYKMGGEKRERAKNLLSTAQEMRDLIEYTGSTQIPFTKSFFGQEGGWNREAVQKRAHFDTLAADLAGFFRELDTKGQLPQGLYEKVIEPRLPSSKLSERENLGRIEALESMARRYGKIPGIPSKEPSNKKSKKSLEELENEYLR